MCLLLVANTLYSIVPIGVTSKNGSIKLVKGVRTCAFYVQQLWAGAVSLPHVVDPARAVNRLVVPPGGGGPAQRKP